MGGDPRLHDRYWLAGEAAKRSAGAIGRDLGVTVDTVLRAMRLHNLPVRFATAPRKPLCSELEDREWLSAQHEQRTAAEIAAVVGVATSR